MSSSGPLRPHPASEEADRKMAAVGLSSSSSSSSRGSGLISSRVGQQQVVATERSTAGKTGKRRRPTVATRTTRANGSSAMTSTRTVSDFVFNFHFLLSIVLLIILGGDLTTLRGGVGGGVWAEETEPFDSAGRGTLMFGDKCESTTDCGFAGSVCDPGTRTCQCTSDLSATNHLDKCGKKAQVNESCFFTEQCEQMTEQTECRDGRCICRFEMNPIFKPDGTVECRATLNKPIVPEKYIDPTMIGVLVAMAVMFIIICVVLRLFSKARWRDNRSIFNTPNPRLMNVSLLRDNKPLHQERRGSRMSVRLPSRQPSMASLRPHSPNASIGKLGSRRGSRGSSNASATSTRSNRSQHAKDNGTAAAHQQNESVTVEITEVRS
ncbi:uncharacterized protein jus isoform X2 [Ochlerotatus camptorhynchus]|uniref:uncharacterized protein jus isoform X2 n=1 Tax=Ochlerotatus camptorhynchus TaxID=644619 RepID=UPI0031DE5AAB